MNDSNVTVVDHDFAPRTIRALDGLPLLGARFRVLGMLGGGGMGNVYLAHDTELDERVAVKLLKAVYSESEEQRALLRREVKLARRVTHPNVLRTFDIGDHEGAKFITMELAEGGTLAGALPRKMALADVARIAHAVCAGLGAAHDVGIVHRDLKPSNVLLAADGRILLSDFGISALADDSRSAGAAGTPGYMAPELLAGEPVDARVDIWALGALLYEMICGARAFPVQYDADYIRPLVAAAPDPTVRRPEMPLALARIVTRCMARQPAARFGHPREISAAIARVLPLPSDTSSPSPARFLLTDAHRKRVLAVLPITCSDDASSSKLADGLTDVLIDHIDSRELHVPSRAAVEATKPAGRDPMEVGRDLGAEAIVVGSLSSISSGVALELRVIGTGDGLLLYSQTVECRVSEMVMVAEEASRSIARALLVDRKDGATPMYEGEVVELYLLGLEHYRRRWGPAIERSSDCFRRALEKAPDDPMLLSAYALSLARRVSLEGGEKLMETARAVSKRAISISPNRPESHLALAAVAYQVAENVTAARVLRVAQAIAPHQPDIQFLLGALAMETKSVADGQAHLFTARTLDPTLVHATWLIARGYALMSDFNACDALFKTPPEDQWALNDYWVNRGRTIFYHPDPERVARFEAELAGSPDFDMKSVVSIAVALARGQEISAEALRTFLSPAYGASRRVAFIATVRAELFSRRSDPEEAMKWLRCADEASIIDIVWMDHCPALGALRRHAGFAAVRARVAARAAEVAEALDSGAA